MGEHGCGCGQPHEGKESNNEEVTMEDLVEENNFVMNCLIDLLIEKKVFSEEELKNKLQEVHDKLSKEASDEAAEAEE